MLLRLKESPRDFCLREEKTDGNLQILVMVSLSVNHRRKYFTANDVTGLEYGFEIELKKSRDPNIKRRI